MAKTDSTHDVLHDEVDGARVVCQESVGDPDDAVAFARRDSDRHRKEENERYEEEHDYDGDNVWRGQGTKQIPNRIVVRLYRYLVMLGSTAIAADAV